MPLNPSLVLTWSMRLACWPFEVEGQGTATPAAPVPAEPAAPAMLPSPPAQQQPPPPRPPLPVSLPLFQEARYDIRYGLLGSVGALQFSVGGVAETADGSRLVKVSAWGGGSVLGLGALQRTIEADFDPTTLESRRWTISRLRGGQTDPQATRDTGSRGNGGTLSLDRTKPGQPPVHQAVTFAAPTSDPLGLLWRLRTAPPPVGRTETLQLLDGLALWRVRVTTVPGREILTLGRESQTALRLEGDVSPIFYDGSPDPDRPTRTFTLWLGDGPDHLPLRLEVPVGLADVVMTLTEARDLLSPGVPPGASAGPSAGAPGIGRQPPGRTDQDPLRDGGGAGGPPPPRSSSPLQLTGPVPGARSL